MNRSPGIGYAIPNPADPASLRRSMETVNALVTETDSELYGRQLVRPDGQRVQVNSVIPSPARGPRLSEIQSHPMVIQGFVKNDFDKTDKSYVLSSVTCVGPAFTHCPTEVTIKNKLKLSGKSGQYQLLMRHNEFWTTWLLLNAPQVHWGTPTADWVRDPTLGQLDFAYLEECNPDGSDPSGVSFRCDIPRVANFDPIVFAPTAYIPAVAFPWVIGTTGEPVMLGGYSECSYVGEKKFHLDNLFSGDLVTRTPWWRWWNEHSSPETNPYVGKFPVTAGVESYDKWTGGGYADHGGGTNSHEDHSDYTAIGGEHYHGISGSLTVSGGATTSSEYAVFHHPVTGEEMLSTVTVTDTDLTGIVTVQMSDYVAGGDYSVVVNAAAAGAWPPGIGGGPAQDFNSQWRHNHYVTQYTHAHTLESVSGTVYGDTDTAGAHTHSFGPLAHSWSDNRPPFICVPMIIRYK
jgi:hypothetical protein